MNKLYELVCVIDSRLSMEDIRQQKGTIENLLWSAQQDVDDMWLLPLAYPLKGQTQAYFVSYAISLETNKLAELKHDLALEKWLAKYHIFSLKSLAGFLKYADLQKAYAQTLPDEEEEETQEETTPASSDIPSEDSLDEWNN